jgi:hypothetical protein
VIRRQISWSAAILALAFLLVLAVPDHDRGLAVFAFLLLAGALMLGALVLALARDPLAAEDRLAGAAAPAHRPPAELVTLTSGIRTALREQVLDERVYGTIRAIATVQLAGNHGIELGRDPAGAHAVIGDGPLWQLLESERTWVRLSVGGRELAQIVDQLERL